MELSSGIESESLQDKLIYICLLDTKYLSRVMLKKIQPRHFTSEVRQKIFNTIIEYYGAYKQSPCDLIVDEIMKKIEQNKIREEDFDMYSQYLMNLFSMGDEPPERILDNLDLFLKKQLVTVLTNTLLKLQDRVDIDPDRPLDEIRRTVSEANIILGKNVVESIKDDEADSIYEREVVSRFNIDPIDRQLGGGFKRGDYVIIQGWLGSGKSWCTNHISKMAVRFGFTPLLIPTEMPNNTAKLRLRMSFGGMTTTEVLKDIKTAKERVESSMMQGSDIFLLSEDEKSTPIDRIPGIIEEIEIRHNKKIDLIILDSADEFLPPTPPKGMRYSDKLERNTAIHTYLKNYAKDNNICIISTAQTKREGNKRWLGPTSVADNIVKLRKATVGISINCLPEEDNRDHCRIWLFKNTDGVSGSRVWVKRNLSRGQFITSWAIYNSVNYWEEYLPKQPLVEGINK